MERDPGRNPQNTASSGVPEQARQQTQQLAQQARQQAGQLANRGGEQVKSQLANQKHQAVQRMAPVQTALRETAHQLRQQDQGSMGQYAQKAADQVERLSGYLRETDVDQIVDEVRGFARSRPALFLGGAAALGFFATRFLKSSSQEEGGGSAGDGSDVATPTTTGGAAAGPRGVGESATAPYTGPVEGEPPTPRRLPTAAGQPPSEGERTEPPRGL